MKTKEEKVKEMQVQQAVRKIRSGQSHMRHGIYELSAGTEILVDSGMTPMIEALEKSRRSLADAISELVRYDK